MNIPYEINDPIFVIGYECSQGMKYNCNVNGIMTGCKCRRCKLDVCDLHKVVREEKIEKITVYENDIEINDVSHNELGRTIFTMKDAAEEAVMGKR